MGAEQHPGPSNPRAAAVLRREFERRAAADMHCIRRRDAAGQDAVLDDWAAAADGSPARPPARELIRIIRQAECDEWYGVSPPDKDGRVWYIDVEAVPEDQAQLFSTGEQRRRRQRQGGTLECADGAVHTAALSYPGQDDEA